MTRVLALAALVAGPCGTAAVVQRPGPEPPHGGSPAVPDLVRDLQGQVDQARKSLEEDAASARGIRNQTRDLWMQAREETGKHQAVLDFLDEKKQEASKEIADVQARLAAMDQSASVSLQDLDTQLEDQASQNSDVARRLAAHQGTQPQDRATFRADAARLAARQTRAKQQLAPAKDRRRALVDKIAKLGEELPLMEGKLAEAGQQHDKLVHTVEMLSTSVDEELRNQKTARQILANLTSSLALQSSIQKSQAATERRQEVESTLGEIKSQVTAMEADHQALAEKLQQKRAAKQELAALQASAVRAVRGATAGITKAYANLLGQLQVDTPKLFSS